MRRGIIAFAVAGLSLGLCITPGITVEVAQAAAGDFTVSPTTVDFGTVAVNVTKTIPVVIKNVSTTTQTPNFSGGAPDDPTNFGGSQNCAGVPLAAGGTCHFSYTFTPKSVGAKTSSTTIGIDNQTFAITFLGCGGTIADCGTTTTSTTTTTKPTTTTTKPTNPTQPAGPQQPAGASTTTVAPPRRGASHGRDPRGRRRPHPDRHRARVQTWRGRHRHTTTRQTRPRLTNRGGRWCRAVQLDHPQVRAAGSIPVRRDRSEVRTRVGPVHNHGRDQVHRFRLGHEPMGHRAHRRDRVARHRRTRLPRLPARPRNTAVPPLPASGDSEASSSDDESAT